MRARRGGELDDGLDVRADLALRVDGQPDLRQPLQHQRRGEQPEAEGTAPELTFPDDLDPRVEGIARVTFKEQDVVRHDLVRRIVTASTPSRATSC
mgnify:CR=1 FL=1